MEKLKETGILDAIFTQATLGIVCVNPRGEIILCNKLAGELFGYSVAELIGQAVETLLPGDLRTSHQLQRNSYFSHPSPRLMGAGRDLYGKRKDGSVFPIEISLNHIDLGTDKVVVAYITNITWRKEQEQKLRKEKELTQMYLEMAGSIILVLDKDENITLINREGALILGLREEKILGRNWFETFIPDQDRDKVRKVFYQLLEHKGDQLEYFENRIMAADGEMRLVSWHNRLLQNEKGEPIGTISSGNDITFTREAELMLQESKERLKNYAIELEQEVAARTAEVFESRTKLKLSNQVAQIGYWEISLEPEKGYAIGWSEEFFRVFDQHYSEEPLPKDYFLQFIHPEDREVVISQTKDAIKTGMDKRLDFRITTSRGEPKYLSSELRGIRNQFGKLTKIFGVIQDVTENKEIEKRLEQNLNKEKELGELKSRFVSMASHEFRTPLSAIQSSVDLIKIYQERDQVDKMTKHVSRIRSSVQNLNNILNDFLSLEKLESGKIIFQPQQMDFEHYMREVLEEIKLVKKDGQQILYTHSGAGEAMLDKYLMRNILTNLLSNAIKYSEEGTRIEVHTEIENGAIFLSVKDQGMGIPEADQEHLMTRFFRATNVTNIQGTGLGLTIVRRYLDMMDGRIWFESEEGMGTTFFVRIPLGT